MRLCILFLLSFLIVVAAKRYGGGPVPIVRRDLSTNYRNIFPYDEFPQAPPPNDDYIQFDDDKPDGPVFTYRVNDDDEPIYKNNARPFAVPPSNILYASNFDAPKSFQNALLKDPASKKMFPFNFDPSLYDDTFSQRRSQRQNPNLAANKFHKVATSTEQPNAPIIQKLHSFGNIKDIPTSLVPASLGHNSIYKEAIKNHQNRDGTGRVMNVYMYAMICSVIAATCVLVAAFVFGWYTIQKKMKAAADAEYPAYGVTGPNTNTSPSGDRRLAHSAQLYHYQHQKQQILAMEKNTNERNGSVSDPESEDENEEGDYTVYECPGFATTGELEVKNPLFLDEPTPATPATVVKGDEK